MKKREHVVSMPGGIAVGVGISLVLSVLGCMLSAWLIGNEKIGESGIAMAGYAVTAVAALLGCWIAVMLVNGRRMQVSLLTGLGYYLTLLAITAMFFEGQFSGIAVPAAIIGVDAAAIGFLTAKSKNKQNSHRVKRAFR